MAMENKRIIQLSTERTTLGDDDYTIVDSDTNGTAKYRLSRLKETDTTLSVSGMAADAAATGQAISDEAEARSDADTTLGNDVQDLKSALTQLDKDINVNLVSGYTANRSITASGVVTTSSETNLYYADVDGLSNVLVTGGSLYGFFNTVPLLGTTAMDNARHETSTAMNNEKIALPTGTKYLAVRNTTRPIIRNADSSNFVTVSATEYTGDFDALLQNSVVTRTSNGATIASNHAPIDGFVGTILTFGLINTNAFRTQIAIYGGNASRYWWRQYYSSWSSWQEIATLNDLTSKISIGTAEYTGDFNALSQGTVATRTSNGATVSTHHAPYDNFVGSVITVGIPNLNYFKGQIAIDGGNAQHIYWRQYYTSWKEWNEIASLDSVDQKANPLDILPCFDNITCCGDSLTQSIVYTGSGSSDYRQAKVPYPKVLEKITGTPVSYYATGGYTAINWWNAYANEIVSKPNQVAIIYLGTNGGLTDTLSTDAPEGTDYSTWANTNTGCYAKMIAKFQSVGAQVILVKTYAGPSDPGVQTTNSVITACADRFHCGLVENKMFTDAVYHYYPDRTGQNTPHYNDLGYSAFARYLSNQIAKMDVNYLKWIIPQ